MIEKEVIDLISSITKSTSKDINAKSTMSDVDGWDSLAHIEIVCAVEKMINRRLTLDEIISAQDVQGWIEIIKNKK